MSVRARSQTRKVPSELGRWEFLTLASRAGLVPVMALAQRAGLGELAGEHVRIGLLCPVNAQVKVACLVAGIAAGPTAARAWACCATARGVMGTVWSPAVPTGAHETEELITFAPGRTDRIRLRRE